MLDHPEMRSLVRVAQLLAERGWAEANAGNMSVRLERDTVPPIPGPFEEFPLKHSFPEADGRWFFVTATKSRARDVPRIPDQTVGLVEMISGGSALRCHWGAAPPTSEFPAHLSIHSNCVRNRPDMKAVLHTHPPNLIAMSHLAGLQKPGALNEALRKMHPEVGILVPGGVGEMGYRIPGSLELGIATGDALASCNVAIWPMHGIVSLAADLDSALDQVEIIEKAARIYMLVLAAGHEPVGLTDQQIRESRAFWGIEDIGQ